MNLGKFIKDYRKSHGLTQSWVAEKAGLTSVQLSLIESGKRKLTADKFLKICNVLNIKPQVAINHILHSLEEEDIKSDKQKEFENIRNDIINMIEFLLQDLTNKKSKA